ncbi:putative peptidoglycan-binding domain-containing protein [Xenococcus sp. PCC 7305]|uniref:peptidoglycan-binding protein n=1 Tax=Xenococcus sp. PCC 7305 TaxID=102125 RepID=UPI0002AC5064|nr:peptidoglycan-binding protein [Xenococcus sp. PCC 7305]ELS00640.1 putative peptidoglycan-binding domain-containing protein [Xenococcus sp. PCC 7305]
MGDTPILFDKPFPEIQVTRKSYKRYTNRIMGSVIVTGGFMEPKGHGYKGRARKAIFRDGSMKTINPGNYNIGFDYTKGFGTKVICMYSGVVTKAGREGGYGHRIHVKLDIPFIYQGKTYTCYQAYAHCSKLLKAPKQRVSQGEAIGIEAGQGPRGPRHYGSHVDLDTYCFIKGEKIHLNFELLAGGVDEDDFIENIEVMQVGTSGLDVRWLQQKLKIKVDGDFGNITKQAVTDYQASQPDLLVDGIAGENTCKKLGLFDYAIYAKKATVIKSQPIQSIDITNPQEKFQFDPKNNTEPLLANWVQEDGDHWKFELQDPKNGRYNWHAFKAHVEIVKGYDSDLDDSDIDNLGDLDPAAVDKTNKDSGALSRWEKALKNCPTDGCLIATAKPENISEPGVAASEEIARRDLKNLSPAILASMKKAGQKLNVPVPIIVALASRESHLGAVLGIPPNKKGWGDNNHGYGILQVDNRSHSIRGLDDPYSQAHIEQAIGIFSNYRDQVAQKHPSWPDEQVLKGACVAYNAGVSNVRTIAKMNLGTTHNDYGDDVIARAQFYMDNI